jgi:hypothetical protein
MEAVEFRLRLTAKLKSAAIVIQNRIICNLSFACSLGVTANG